MASSSTTIPAGYKQTEVGVIPQDWKIVSIFELAEKRKSLFDDGDWIEAEHISERGVRLIQTGNIGVGEFKFEPKKYIFEDSFDLLKCKVIQVGDLLISRLAHPAGRSCVLPDIGEKKMITSVDVTIFRPSSNIANRIYLQNLFSASRWLKLVENNSGGTTHKRIARSTMGKLVIGLPSINEQKAIANSFNDIDDFIGSLNSVIAKKRNIKQGTMQELLTGKTRLSGFSGEWEVKQLNHLCSDIKRGASPRPITNPKWFDNNSQIGWVRISDATSAKRYLLETKQKLSGEGVQRSRYIPKGNLIMSICATVGRPIQTQIDVCIHDGFVIFENIFIDQNFLYYVLCDLEPRWSDKGQTGSQMNLNTELIKSTEISLPSDLSEQEAIAEVLSDMDAEIAALEERLEKAKAIKQGMMQQLLTGKIRLID